MAAVASYYRRTHSADQTKINEEKLRIAKTLVGESVVILGVERSVVGYDEHTGDIMVRMARSTEKFDPRMFPVVTRK